MNDQEQQNPIVTGQEQRGKKHKVMGGITNEVKNHNFLKRHEEHDRIVNDQEHHGKTPREAHQDPTLGKGHDSIVKKEERSKTPQMTHHDSIVEKEELRNAPQTPHHDQIVKKGELGKNCQNNTARGQTHKPAEMEGLNQQVEHEDTKAEKPTIKEACEFHSGIGAKKIPEKSTMRKLKGACGNRSFSKGYHCEIGVTYARLNDHQRKQEAKHPRGGKISLELMAAFAEQIAHRQEGNYAPTPMAITGSQEEEREENRTIEVEEEEPVKTSSNEDQEKQEKPENRETLREEIKRLLDVEELLSSWKAVGIPEDEMGTRYQAAYEARLEHREKDTEYYEAMLEGSQNLNNRIKEAEEKNITAQLAELRKKQTEASKQLEKIKAENQELKKKHTTPGKKTSRKLTAKEKGQNAAKAREQKEKEAKQTELENQVANLQEQLTKGERAKEQAEEKAQKSYEAVQTANRLLQESRTKDRQRDQFQKAFDIINYVSDKNLQYYLTQDRTGGLDWSGKRTDKDQEQQYTHIGQVLRNHPAAIIDESKPWLVTISHSGMDGKQIRKTYNTNGIDDMIKFIGNTARHAGEMYLKGRPPKTNVQAVIQEMHPALPNLAAGVIQSLFMVSDKMKRDIRDEVCKLRTGMMDLGLQPHDLLRDAVLGKDITIVDYSKQYDNKRLKLYQDNENKGYLPSLKGQESQKEMREINNTNRHNVVVCMFIKAVIKS